MAFPNNMYLNQSSKNNVRQWLGFAFALLAFAFPLVWFMSSASDAIINKMIRVMFVFFLFWIGQKAPRLYYKDTVILLCTLLILMLVAGYIWQRFSLPEELFNGSRARKFIPSFCFFVVVAYGISATPKSSPFVLLITAGAGLLIHLSFLPVDIWLASWQGMRLDFELQNAQHAGVIFSTALLAAIFFLPRAFSLPFRARMLALPLLVGLILLMIFGVIATQTRAVWLGLGLSAITLLSICAATLLTGRYSLRWNIFTRATAIGIGILLAGSVMLYFMGGGITQRLSEETVDIATIMERAQLKTVPRSSVGVRIGSWSAAREWIAERPVFGWGGHEVSKLFRQSPHFDEAFKKRYKHLHNSYLETLVNVGGAAFMCMIAITFLVAWRTIMTWRQGQMPTDVFLFSWAYFLFWITVNIFEPYIVNAAGFFLNAVIGGFVYSWYLRCKMTEHVVSGPSAYRENHSPVSGNYDVETYNSLAELKTEILNTFIAEHNIGRVIEFYSGDSNQLSLFNFKSYTGFDVSHTDIKLAREKFAENANKTFLHMNEYADQTAELTLSLNINYHLIEDDVFDAYVRRLFASAEKYVIIYTSDKTDEQWTGHTTLRKFTDWMNRNAINFNLLQFVPNKYLLMDNRDNPKASLAGFYVFENKAAATSTLQTVLPKISILVPVFNTEKFLRQCLDSILSQSYENIEIICVNDCSTDNSLDVLNEYAQNNQQIIIIDKRVNEGLPQARKAALSYSTGEYILPIDSDDWIEQNMVEDLYRCLVFGGYDMVCCGYFHERNNGSYFFDPPQILPEDKMERIKYGIFGFGNAKVVWNKLVKREIYEKVKFGKENNGEDCYITCQSLFYADKIGYYPLPLYHLGWSEGSLTANKFIAQSRYEDRKANYKHVIEFCREKFGDDLRFFEPELEKRMTKIEKQKPKTWKNKLLFMLERFRFK